MLNITCVELDHHSETNPMIHFGSVERNENMNIISTLKQGRVPVTVLQLTGQLDGSNYLQLDRRRQKDLSQRCTRSADRSEPFDFYEQRRHRGNP